MVDNKDNVWVFWYVKTSDETSLADGYLVSPLPTSHKGVGDCWGYTSSRYHRSGNARSPTAVSDAEGGIWLFWAESSPALSYAQHGEYLVRPV